MGRRQSHLPPGYSYVQNDLRIRPTSSATYGSVRRYWHLIWFSCAPKWKVDYRRFRPLCFFANGQRKWLNGGSTPVVGPESLWSGRARVVSELWYISQPLVWCFWADGADHSDTRTNKTSTQVFWWRVLGGGWTVGSAPTFSYDWNKDHRSSIKHQVSLKQRCWNGRPVRYWSELLYWESI